VCRLGFRKPPHEEFLKLTIELDREADGRWIAEVPELNVLLYGNSRQDANSTSPVGRSGNSSRPDCPRGIASRFGERGVRRRVFAALQRIGWRHDRTVGSHKACLPVFLSRLRRARTFWSHPLAHSARKASTGSAGFTSNNSEVISRISANDGPPAVRTLGAAGRFRPLPDGTSRREPGRCRRATLRRPDR